MNPMQYHVYWNETLVGSFPMEHHRDMFYDYLTARFVYAADEIHKVNSGDDAIANEINKAIKLS